MTSEKVEFKRGLTPRSMILAILIMVTVEPLGELIWFYTNKPGTYGGFIIPFIYFVFILEALALLNKRFKFTPQEYVVLFLTAAVVTGAGTFPKFVGQYDTGLYQYTDFFYSGIITGLNEQAATMMTKVPWFLFPEEGRVDIAKMLYVGLSPGQTLPWASLMPNLVLYVVSGTLFTLLALFMAFGLMGKPWVETEMLPFPIALPPVVLINMTEPAPDSVRSRLFDFKRTEAKIFWASFFILGIPSTLAPLLGEVFPAIAGLPAWWGDFPINFEPLGYAMPGIMAYGWITYCQLYTSLILPFGTLITVLIVYVVFGIIYSFVGVLTGAIPYTPRMEFTDYEYAAEGAMLSPPFPYAVIGYEGCVIGAGILCLWLLRGRFRELYSSLKGQDVMEHGMSLKFITILGLVGLVGLLAMFTVTGVPILITVVWLMIYFVWETGACRASGEVWWHSWDLNSADWRLTYPVGVAAGYYPASIPSDGAPSSWVTFRVFTAPQDNWISRCVGVPGPMLWLHTYKVAHYNRTDLGDVVKSAVLLSIIGFVISWVAHTYLFAHAGGISRTNAWGWTTWSMGNLHGDSFWPPEPDYSSTYVWTLIGIAIVFGVYAIRRLLPWIPLNAMILGFVLSCLEWYWLVLLIVLVVKYIMIRIVGVKKFMEYVMPLAAGTGAGFSSLYIVALLYNAFTVALPKFYSLYIP